MRFLFALLVLVLTATPCCAQRFVAIAFHRVVDDEHELGTDDITTAQLIAFFDWLKGNGWSSISLDDVEAARAGIRPLPARPILLTFDDGFESAYTRVYPLLLAYRFHAVFALVGSWMDAAPNGTVRYGDQDVPRTRFLGWDQAREMAASGLAEFASHTYDLHRGIRANPEGSMIPAAATWAYDARTSHYETNAEFQARVLADLQRSIGLMRRYLGKAPRALAWPYGRYAGPAMAAARQAGIRDILGLVPEPAYTSGDPSQPLVIPRRYPTRNPTLGIIAPSLRLADPDPEQSRIVCLGLGSIASGTAAQANAALGHTIENIRQLGADVVVLDPVAERAPTGAIQSVWFQSALLPVKADYLSFVAWQLHSRGGVSIFLDIDLHAAAASVGRERVGDLVREIVRVAPVDGIVLSPPGPFSAGGTEATGAYPWIVRVQRDAVRGDDLDSDGRLSLDAWRVADEVRPHLRLAIALPSQPTGLWPAPAADLVLLPQMPDGPVALAQSLAARGWLAPSVSPRLALPLPQDPSDLVPAMRQAQALGASAFALCPAPALPADPKIDAAFSASRFPRRP